MANDAVSKDMPIGDVVRQHPETVPVFFKHGLHCIGCQVAAYESVADGAAAHGIDIDVLMKDLNEAVAEKAAGGDDAASPKEGE